MRFRWIQRGLQAGRKRVRIAETSTSNDATKERPCCKITEDVSVEVGADDRVETCGFVDHSDGHGVDEHLVPLDVGEVLGDLGGDLVPEAETVSLRERQQIREYQLGSQEAKEGAERRRRRGRRT